MTDKWMINPEGIRSTAPTDWIEQYLRDQGFVDEGEDSAANRLLESAGFALLEVEEKESTPIDDPVPCNVISTRLARADGPDVVFKGRLLCSLMDDIENPALRLQLWDTVGGNFIALKKGMELLAFGQEKWLTYVRVCRTRGEVFSAFGQSATAHKLYKRMDWKYLEEVE